MHKAAIWLLGLILVVAPLAFGTVEQWSLTLVETLSLSLLALSVWSISRDKKTVLRSVPGTLPLLLILAYMVFQVIPLPHFMITLLSRHTADIYEKTVWAVSPDSWVTLALNKKVAVLKLCMFLSCFSVYFASVSLFSYRPGMQGLVAFLIAFVAVVSMVSIIEHVTSPDAVFFVRSLPQGARPFGPFVNRNHYAGFANMIFSVALALMFVSRPKVYGWTFREKLSNVLDSREANIFVLLGLGTVMIGTSAFLTLSRGGIISLCVAVVALAISMKIKLAKKSAYTLLIGAFLFGAVGWFGWVPIIERFLDIPVEDITVSESRPVIWRNSLELAKQAPITGVGFGGFEDAYRTLPSAENDRIVEHAHNDYLELLVDGGGTGFSLYAWFVISIFISSIRKLRNRRDPLMIGLSLGALSGMMAILFHGLVDFNLQIGANEIYFFFLAALAVSSAHISSHGGKYRSLLKPSLRMSPKVILTLSVLLTVMVALVNAGVLAGQIGFSKVKDTYLSSMTDDQTLQKVSGAAVFASRIDPLEGKYQFAYANTLFLRGKGDEALSYYYRAIGLAPLNTGYLERTSVVSTELSEVGKAGMLLQAATSLEPSNPRLHKSYAEWLVQQGQRQEGIEQLHTAILLEPEKTRDYIGFMVLLGLDVNEQMQAIPQKCNTLIMFGDYLAQVDRYGLAEETYQHSLDILSKDCRVSQDVLLHVADFFNERQKDAQALAALERAREYLPETAFLQIRLGTQYEKMQMPYQAIEAFKRAMVLEPGNRTAELHLTRLVR